jgi:hypothetical protein
MRLFRHAGLDELALACPVLDTGYLIRGHPDVVPTKVGNHLKDWIPGFHREPWIPAGVYPVLDTGPE